MHATEREIKESAAMTVYPIQISREWAPICEGIEARYSAIWGAGEFARVIIELREAPVITTRDCRHA